MIHDDLGPEWELTTREFGHGEVRVCDPPFQPIDRLGCTEAVIALPPCPRCLDGAEQSVEMIGTGVVAKVVWCYYAEAVAPWGFLAEGLQQIEARLVLIGGLLFPCVVFIATATDEMADENTGIGLYGDALRIAFV